jgi:hypothetical protein
MRGGTIQLGALLWSGSLPVVTALFAALAVTRARRAWIASLVGAAVLAALVGLDDLPRYWVTLLPYAVLLVGLGIERVAPLDARLARALAVGLALVSMPVTALRLYTAWQGPTTERYYEVARMVDGLAGRQGTLLVCGPSPSETIQFASHLKTAHRVWAFSQMQPNVLARVPSGWPNTLAEYLAAPPDVLVVEADYFHAASRQVDSGQPLPPHLELFAALVQQVPYKALSQLAGYIILKREA